MAIFTYKKIKSRLKHFNKYLIKDYRRQQFQIFLKYMDISFKSVEEMINDPTFKYKGYRIVPPDERALYEIVSEDHIKNSVNILPNELLLVEYIFENYSTDTPIHIFLPYCFEDTIVVNGTKYLLKYILEEKIFFSIKNGFNMKVKLPINFHITALKCYTSLEGYQLVSPIYSIRIHNRKKSAADKITLMHYLLCKYGINVFELFGYKDDVSITDSIQNDQKWVNFDITASKVQTSTKIYLSANYTKIKIDYMFRRVIASVLRVFELIKFPYNLKEIYDKDNSLFKIALGTLIYPEHKNLSLVGNHVNLHLESLSSYMDTLSLEKLSPLNITSIWDIIFYVFKNFEKIMNDIRNNDLFTKRVELTEHLIEDIYISKLYKQIYSTMGRNYTTKNVSNIRYLDERKKHKINDIYKNSARAQSNYGYNENMLINYLAAVSSLPPSKAQSLAILKSTLHKTHASHAIVKDLNYWSSSNPMSNMILNPFLQIDEKGNVIKNEEICKTLSVFEK